MQERTGITKGALMRGLRALREMQMIHVHEYERTLTKLRPIWKRGNKPDAEKLPPIDSTRRTKAWRARNPDWDTRQLVKKAGVWGALVKIDKR